MADKNDYTVTEHALRAKLTQELVDDDIYGRIVLKQICQALGVEMLHGYYRDEGKSLNGRS